MVRTLRLLDTHDSKDCRRDISEASASLLVLSEGKTLGLLSGHDEGNGVGGVGGVRVSGLGVEHLLGARVGEANEEEGGREERRGEAVSESAFTRRDERVCIGLVVLTFRDRK